MKKKIIAALLAATMVAAAVPVYAADDAAANTATESTTESPLKDCIHYVYVICNNLPDVVGFIYRNSREAWHGSKHFLLQ